MAPIVRLSLGTILWVPEFWFTVHTSLRTLLSEAQHDLKPLIHARI
jgi:hypothetical protein